MRLTSLDRVLRNRRRSSSLMRSARASAVVMCSSSSSMLPHVTPLLHQHGTTSAAETHSASATPCSRARVSV